MEFFRGDFWQLPKGYLTRSVVTLGNFDGVHLGHQDIFRRLITKSKELSLPSVAISFYPHPLKVLRPERAPLTLTPLKEKVKLLKDSGLDVFICLNFSLKFADLSAYRFVKEFLVEKVGAQEVYVGRDFRFGRERVGDVNYLRKLGAIFVFEVKVIEPVVVRGHLVSSTRIRRLLLQGKVDEANLLLGRPYKILGRVIKGTGRGKGLGFPTANIEPENEVIPKRGVYFVLVSIDFNVYPAVANIGYNPTFGGEKKIKVEVHIIDFFEDLYNKEINISFFERLRGEEKFNSVGELVEQIRSDVESAKRLWGDGLKREFYYSYL